MWQFAPQKGMWQFAPPHEKVKQDQGIRIKEAVVSRPPSACNHFQVESGQELWTVTTVTLGHSSL